MIKIFSAIKIAWALGKVGIRTGLLTPDLRRSMEEFAQTMDMRPEELAAFLVCEEPSLVTNFDKAHAAIQKWRVKGKVRAETLRRAKFRYLVEDFRFRIFKP